MSFPLGEWIDDHATAPHHLASSGMPQRMPTVLAALRRPEPPDPEALRSEIARQHGVRAGRVFLTHGATEANTLALFYLARSGGGPRHRAPRCAIPTPEYPPIRTTAVLAGFQIVSPSEDAEGIAFSRPNNPTGTSATGAELDERLAGRRWAVVDETFRGFTAMPSLVRRFGDLVWAMGSFTKLYGGDDLRVGFIVAPERSVEGFAAFHGVLLDRIAPHSVGAARAILRDREPILEEVRGRVDRNFAALRAIFPAATGLSAPVWFDRPEAGRSTDSLGHRALRDGVLVCPGSFFGQPDGVRICLTRPSFRADLEAYLRVRSRWTSPTRTPRSPSSPRPGRAAPR